MTTKFVTTCDGCGSTLSEEYAGRAPALRQTMVSAVTVQIGTGRELTVDEAKHACSIACQRTILLAIADRIGR
ncbi:MAG: hypothetical protein QUS11_03495 [Candidatus Fermentibacter sp.]|nr:hypothetical protein [Candidatus Fermentibacter sp.]